MKAIFQFIKGKIWFFLSFVMSKGVVFIAPLLVAELLSKEDFGILEYALAGLGMVLNTLINAGVPAAYPYFKLKDSQLKLNNAFALHYIWLLLFFSCVQIAYLLFDFSLHYYIALNVAYIISNQVYISTQLKTNEKISYAVFIDSGVYIILLSFYILSYFGIAKPDIEVFSSIILGYALVYSIYAISRAITLNKHKILYNYGKVLSYSIHVLISGLLIYFITVSGRILIEFFLKDFEIVGIYAYYFRLSAVVVMIYQVINIAFFKQMYLIDPKTLDKYFSLCFLVLYVISIVIFTCIPYILPYFSQFFTSTIQAYKGVYFLLSTQMIFWIATALLSNIIDREKLASKNNPHFLVLLILFICSLFVFKNILSLDVFTLIHLMVVLCAAIIQIYTLMKKKIYFKKSLLTLLFIGLICVLIYAFIL